MAHQARMYDYLLAGKDNYAADRAAAEAWIEVDPDIAFTVRANRAFLGRVVRYLAGEAGIRQFPDIGTGIPTAGSTHEVARAIAPGSRVVYVDYGPIVLAHARALPASHIVLAHARALLTSHGAGATDYIDADLRDTTAAILDRDRQDVVRGVADRLIQQMPGYRTREQVRCWPTCSAPATRRADHPNGQRATPDEGTVSWPSRSTLEWI